MIKLIAVDVDQTLVGDDLTLSPRLVRDIEEIRKRGIHFTLATGRAFFSAMRFAGPLNIDLPLITFGGALIINPKTHEVIFKLPLAAEVAAEAYRIMKEFDLHINIHTLEDVFSETNRPEVELYYNLTSTAIKIVPDAGQLLADSPMKLLAVSPDQALLNQVELILRKELGSRINTARSLPNFLEVVHQGASKGKALKILAEKLGVKREEIMAVGDSYNDLDMLEYAGFGVAMEPAPSEVKARARHIGGKAGEEGLAIILEKFVLEQK